MKLLQNWLYVCTDHNGLIKVGITGEQYPEKRIEQFSKDYECKFDLILAVPVEKIKAQDLETFFHKFLNSQFLNVKFLYEQFGVLDFQNDRFPNVNFQKIVDSKADGYTEVFLSHPGLIVNLLVYANFLELINISEKDLLSVFNIESFPIKDLFKNNGINKKINILKEKELFELPQTTSLQNNATNGRINTLQINNKIFFESCNEDSGFTFEVIGDDVILSNGKKTLNLNNFINSNNNIDYSLEIMDISNKIKNSDNKTLTEKLKHFFQISNKIANETKDISLQKNKRNNINNILTLVETEDTNLVVKYLDLLISSDFFNEDFNNLINYLREEISSKSFINYYPKHNKSTEDVFIEPSVENDVYFYEGRDFLKKIGNLIGIISNKESLTALKEEIKYIEDVLLYTKNKDYSGDFLNVFKKFKDIAKFNPNLISGKDYTKEKLNQFLFSVEFEKPNGINACNLYINRKIKEIENRKFLLSTLIKDNVLEIINDTTIDFSKNLNTLFELEYIHGYNNLLDKNFLLEVKIGDKTLKDVVAEQQNIAYKNIREKYMKLLNDFNYTNDWSKIEIDFFKIHNLSHWDNISFLDNMNIFDRINEEFGNLSEQYKNESKSLMFINKFFLDKHTFSEKNKDIIKYFSIDKNVKSSILPGSWILNKYLTKIEDNERIKDITSILSQRIIFENREINIDQFFLIVQSRNHFSKSSYSLDYYYSCISCYNDKLVSPEKFFGTVQYWNKILFNDGESLNYSFKNLDFSSGYRSDRINALGSIIHILKNKEMFSEYELPDEFVHNISNDKFVCNVINNNFPELSNFLIQKTENKQKIKI